MTQYVYHATRYSEQIKKEGFLMKHSYEARNEKLGAGEAMYFSFERGVAESYINAAANESFLPIIIEELKEADEKAGYLLKSIYTNGYEAGWEDFIKVHGEDFEEEYEKSYDLNDVADLADFIRGSKTLEEKEEENNANFLQNNYTELPYPIIEDAKKMGIKTIPGDGKILKYKLNKEARIKDIGYTKNSVQEAQIAKEEGYQGLVFTNDYSIDEIPELALFDTSVLEEAFKIKERVKVEHINLEIIETVLEILNSYRRELTVPEIIEDLIEIDLIDENLSNFDIDKSLKNILATMYKCNLIDVLQDNLIKSCFNSNKESLKSFLSKTNIKDEKIKTLMKNLISALLVLVSFQLLSQEYFNKIIPFEVGNLEYPPSLGQNFQFSS